MNEKDGKWMAQNVHTSEIWPWEWDVTYICF